MSMNYKQLLKIHSLDMEARRETWRNSGADEEYIKERKEMIEDIIILHYQKTGEDITVELAITEAYKCYTNPPPAAIIDRLTAQIEMNDRQKEQDRKRGNDLQMKITEMNRAKDLEVARLKLHIMRLEQGLEIPATDGPLSIVGISVDWGEACFCGLTPDDPLGDNPYPEYGLYLTIQEFDEEARKRAIIFNRRTADSGYSKTYPKIIFNRGTHSSRCDLEFHDCLTFSWKKHVLDFLNYELENPYQETRSDEETQELIESIKEYKAL